MIRLAMMRGDTRPLSVTLSDADGLPINLDELSEINFTARLYYDDTTGIITKTLADGVAIDDASAGTCTVTIDPADTSDLTYSRRYVWDIEVVTDYEETKTVARGYLFVYRDVTTA